MQLLETQRAHCAVQDGNSCAVGPLVRLQHRDSHALGGDDMICLIQLGALISLRQGLPSKLPQRCDERL